jgi:hypothetical protein
MKYTYIHIYPFSIKLRNGSLSNVCIHLTFPSPWKILIGYVKVKYIQMKYVYADVMRE